MAGTPAPQVTTSPGLYPAFDRAVTDYVVRCDGTPVGVHVDAGGATVSVDGGPPSSGSFDTQVPVTAGQAFRVEVTDFAGTTTHHVRCLPPDFPGFTAQVTGTPQASFYVTAPSMGSGSPYSAIFDARGVPVWWASAHPRPINATYLSDATIGWAQFPADQNGFDIRTLGNAHLRQVRGVGGNVTDEHELQRYPNGDYLIAPIVRLQGRDLSHCGGSTSGELLDTPMQRVRPDGSLVWSWSTTDHIPITETPPAYFAACRRGDPHHFNSIEPVGENHILISYRHLNAVYKVDITTGEIVWKLGGIQTAKSLTIVGDPLNGPVAQHDARWLGDGTVTIHDNRSGTGTPPRAIRYRVDETAGTATLVEQVGNPLVTSSGCCGSARRLSGGNWVMSWGGQPTVTEQTAAGDTVFRLSFTGVFTYRAQPLTTEVSADTLRAAMDAHNPRAALARVSGTRLHYQSAVGQDNDVTVFLDGAQFRIRDANAPISPQAGCTAVAVNEVACSAPAITSLYIGTQDGDDVVTQTTPAPSTIEGGAGDDTLGGGPGADTLNGGPGADTATYASRTTPVTVSLDDARNDGAPGEGDNALTENVAGGAAADVLHGSAGANVMYGRGGGDSLNGLGGDDRIDGSGGDDTMTGGAGADILNGNHGTDTASYAARARPVVVTLDLRSNDGAAGERDNVRAEVVIGGSGADDLTGSPLDDTLIGGPGADVLRGMDGNDALMAGDGGSDTALECDGGAAPGGADRAQIDSVDPAPANCETVSSL